MLNDLIVLLDNYPGALFIVLAIGGTIGMGVERWVEAQRKAERKAYWQGRRHGGRKTAPLQDAAAKDSKAGPERSGFDATDQLRVVMEADFTSRALLNRPERRLLVHLDRILADEVPEWRVMCQVSLGEILASKHDEAFRAVNSKRVDFLIVDTECLPLYVIEFQGRGHHQGTAAARDAVKREALRRAGIGYVEVSSGDTPAELRTTLQKLAGKTQLASVIARRPSAS